MPVRTAKGSQLLGIGDSSIWDQEAPSSSLALSPLGSGAAAG